MVKMPKPRTPSPTGKDPATGKFVAGNRFWEQRSSHGANPKFENAGDLWNACAEYFEWNESNPLYEAKPFAFQGSVTIARVEKMRAMTIGGLCMFLDVTFETWTEWRKTRSDLSEVMAWAENVIYRQKFEGASADMLNPNIIARDLGLANKKDLSSTDGSMSPTRIVIEAAKSDDQRDD
jgi:hypothetical protein